MSEQNISVMEAVQNAKDLVHPDELNKENVISTDKITSPFGYSSATDEPMDYAEGEEQMVFKNLNNVGKILSVEDDELDYDESMDTDSSVDSPKKKTKLELSTDESDSQSEDFLSSSAQVKSFSDSLNSVSKKSVHGNSALGAPVVSTENKTEEEKASEPNKTDVPELEDGELHYEEDEASVKRAPKLAGDVEVIEEKLEKRAKRFGLNVIEMRISEDALLALYRSFGIPFHHVRSGKLTTVRLNTIHMYGVEDMQLADILSYFDLYSPQHVEMINRSSCNVVFGSDSSAARAMLGTSFGESVKSGRPLADSDEKEGGREKTSGHSQQSTNEEIGGVNIEETELSSLPPGTWRKGYPSLKSDRILLRFATIDDKPANSFEEKQKYFPYNEGAPGLISSSRKRKIMAPQRDRSYYSLDNRSPQKKDKAFSLDNRPPQQRAFQSRMWSKSRRQSHHSDEEESWPGYHSSSVVKQRGRHASSHTKKFQHFERKVRGHSDENTVYAGNKPVYMSMYADSVEGTWQTVKPQPEDSYKEKDNGTLSETSAYKSSSVQQAPHPHPGKVVPERLLCWNTIAKDMVKDSELAEEQEYYLPRHQQSSRHDDLRSKLQVPSTSYQRPRRFENDGGGDLRSKLQSLRSGDAESRHRSPLMIKISK